MHERQPRLDVLRTQSGPPRCSCRRTALQEVSREPPPQRCRQVAAGVDHSRLGGVCAQPVQQGLEEGTRGFRRVPVATCASTGDHPDVLRVGLHLGEAVARELHEAMDRLRRDTDAGSMQLCCSLQQSGAVGRCSCGRRRSRGRCRLQSAAEALQQRCTERPLAHGQGCEAQRGAGSRRRRFCGTARQAVGKCRRQPCQRGPLGGV
mmetsp:Transcript_98184/g.316687  ORF Transcript_98184/g.316687 Transcript_98184/m.316687 type:complete len:206 (-) Transcript_98184:179-796(-)